MWVMCDCQAPELSANVEGLLVAVKATNDFESDMAKRFGGSSADSAADEVSPCIELFPSGDSP